MENITIPVMIRVREKQGEIEYITGILDELFQNKYLFGGG